MTEINKLIGLKVGSTYACAAYENGQSNVETVIRKSCIWYNRNQVTEKIEEIVVGDDSKPGAIFPLHKGIIESDTDIKHVVNIIEALGIPKHSRIVASIPATEIRSGQNRLKEAIETALSPIAKPLVFSEVFCGAVQALGKKSALNSNFLAINMGSTTTEVGIFLHGKVVHLSTTADISGTKLDHKILSSLQNKLGDVIITLPEVRRIKEQFNMESPQDTEFAVRTPKGMHKEQTSEPISTEILEYCADVAEYVNNIQLSMIDKDTFAQVIDTPIVLTGGMINIPGLPERFELMLQEMLNYKVKVIKQPNGHIAPALGALIMAKEMASIIK